ncbi:TetR/AcrR family transcriptional regulator [Frankia sp. QA3]|uniref:TetR/AcrR family transcriptional regulator n=1 Tax=Frankia sp. QA3 TaxID=710111 RepID=UPI000269BB60|nr:TetR/AcrR family transcriptional regulator [Frankia sp. QA3]EIV92615.1 transcriptional regulator [Frankia sp. QA3]
MALERAADRALQRDGFRGRIDKRQAILQAAWTVFSRDGYSHATIEAIAMEARVAKTTIYNHFGDKETLLRHAVAADAERVAARNIAAIERLVPDRTRLRAALEELGYQLLRCHCDEQSWQLRRILVAEVGRLPDLLDIADQRAMSRIVGVLADRFARLTIAGLLTTGDPLLAAEQFSALLNGPADARSRLGTRRISDRELHALARDAVSTFLQAFGPPAREA